MNTANTTRRTLAAAATLALSAAAAAGQSFPANAPADFGWLASDNNTASFQWEFFNTPAFSTANDPDAALSPSPLPAEWPDPAVGEFTNAAELTSTLNIYAINNPGYFRIDVPSFDAADTTNPAQRAPTALDPAAAPPGSLYTAVLVQARTLGLRIVRDNSITLLPTSTADPLLDTPDTNPPANWPLQGQPPALDQPVVLFDGPDDIVGAGDIVDETFLFELPGAHPQLTILFNTEQNTSLDKLAIDTAVLRVPSPPDTPCPADTNDDDTIDLNDLLTVLSNFATDTQDGPAGGDVAPSDPGTPPGDGTVDLNDLLLVLSNFATTCNTNP